MNIVVFSKDRACQLELFLRSISDYFEESSYFGINVLYTFTNTEFEKGYKKLIEMYPDVRFKLEENFKEDLLSLIDFNKVYSVFFVDDIVFKEDFTVRSEKFELFTSSNDISCLTLRLHPRLNETGIP